MEQIIAFPAFGVEMTLNRVAFSIMGKDIFWYGIIIGMGFLLALSYVNHYIDRFGLTSDQLYDTVIWALPAAIVGARLYYVAFEWSYYSQHLDQIIAIWNGGLAIYGGVIGALIAVYICGKRFQINFAPMCDIAGMGLLIGQMIGRWGNFMNGEAHGGETLGLLGMTVNGAGPYHPTFLYESMWNLVGFLLIHAVFMRAYKFKGELFLLYLIWYGAGRAWIEGLRTDSLYLGTTDIRVSQVLAAITCIAGLAVLLKCMRAEVKTVQQLWNPHANPNAQYRTEQATDVAEQ